MITALLLLGVSFVVFIILYLSPGDPFSVLLEGQGRRPRRRPGCARPGGSQGLVRAVPVLALRYAAGKLRHLHPHRPAGAEGSAADGHEYARADHRVPAGHAPDRGADRALFRCAGDGQALLAADHVLLCGLRPARVLARLHRHLLLHPQAGHLPHGLRVFLRRYRGRSGFMRSCRSSCSASGTARSARSSGSSETR